MNEYELEAIEGAITRLAHAITPPSGLGGEDAAGGHVTSLTEAGMGITAGLVRVAEAVADVAAAIREHTAAACP